MAPFNVVVALEALPSAVTVKFVLTIVPPAPNPRAFPAPIEKRKLETGQVNFFAYRYRRFFCRRHRGFLKSSKTPNRANRVTGTVADVTAVANATGR